MTEIHELANVLICAVLAAVLAYLYLWEFRAYREAKTRDALFELRDELFEYWEQRELSFGGLQAYGMLRLMLNGAIRFVHTCTVLNGLVMRLFLGPSETVKADQQRQGNRWEEALAELDEDAKRKVQSIHSRYILSMFEQTIVSSPFLFAIGMVPLILLGLILMISSRLQSWVVRRIGPELDYGTTSAAQVARHIQPAA